MRSIERRLLAWTLGALTAGALLLLAASYWLTLDEMSEVFDDNLMQVAMAVARHHRFEAGPARQRNELPALPSPYEQDPRAFEYVTLAWSRDGRLQYISDSAVTLPFSARTGLARVTSGGERWHVYTVVLPEGVVQAAQRASSRRTLAGESASKLTLPALLLIVVTALLIVAALRRGLRPLDAATADVAARSGASLEPIGEAQLPREIHPLIRAINGLLQRLGHAMAVQRRFVADAAHELRSPVTALRLQLQLLERAKDESSRKRAIAELKAGVERAQRLLEQLLSLARAEPDAPGRRDPVDLAELVRDAVALRSAEADDRGIDLGADAPQSIVVHGDREHLLVLLDNLIGNALRHAGQGVTVDVRATRLDGHPALQVIDNGTGIAEPERERVFDRFYRGERAGAAGSGLGLAIVRAIAERHGATVSLHTCAGGRGLEVRAVFE